MHVRDGQVRLYTMNGAGWSKRYRLIVEAAGRIEGSVILDAEVVWLDPHGVPNLDVPPSHVNDASAVPCAFDV